MDFPTIQVSAQLPGASAETMASSVANPLEQQFGQIAGVTQLTSTSTLGNTQVNIQFELNRNIDAAAQDVQAAITAAGRRLPTTLSSPPSYRKFNPADPPILILSVTSDTVPLTEADDYAENILAQQISQIQGVAFVLIGGQQKPAIRVQIDPEKLATRGSDARRCPRRSRKHHRRRRQGHAERREAELHGRRQRPDHEARGLRQHHPHL